MEDKEVLNTFNNVKDIVSFILISFLSIIQVLCMINPFSSFISENQYNFLKIIGFFGILLLLFYLYIVFNNYKDKSKFYKDILPIFFFLLFMIWTLFSSIFAPNSEVAFLGTDYRKDGYISYILYAGCFSLSFGMCSKRMRKLFLYIFYLAAVLMIVLMIYMSR